jgi:nickel/cobalt exporter
MESMMRARKVLLAAGLGVGVVVVTAAPASAHPLGNFSMNTSLSAQVAPEGVHLDYVVDLAEIPTLQAQQAMDADRNGNYDPGEQAAWRDGECAKFAASTTVSIGAREATLTGSGRSIVMSPGLAGLSTLRLVCQADAPAELGNATHDIKIETRYSAGRVGWHEVYAVGDAMTLESSDVATTSPSAALTAYPTDQISSPPDQRTMTLRVRPGGPRLDHSATTPSASPLAHSSVPGVDRATRAFTKLVTSQDLTVRIGVVAVAVAFILGAFHALAPGHGKTVMAAYLVGQRGSLRQALGIGASVTITHTAGVVVLGLILSVSTVIAPERLYPLLGAFSGLLLASIGVGLLVRARRLRKLGVAAIWHGHDHGPDGHSHSNHSHGRHSHDHHSNDHHSHGHQAPEMPSLALASTTAFTVPQVPALTAIAVVPSRRGDVLVEEHPHQRLPLRDYAAAPVAPPDQGVGDRGGDGGPLGWRWVVAMGFAGGMVPSPSALVVLLGAIALGRTWFGVSLVLAYGLGMAVTLVIAGLLLTRARARIEVLVQSERGQRWAHGLQLLPLLSAFAIIGGGLLVTARALKWV